MSVLLQKRFLVPVWELADLRACRGWRRSKRAGGIRASKGWWNDDRRIVPLMAMTQEVGHAPRNGFMTRYEVQGSNGHL